VSDLTEMGAQAQVPPAASPLPARPRLFDPLPLSMLLAMGFTAAGLVELLTRGPVPAGHRPDDTLLIALTVASALSLSLLWRSQLGALALAVLLLCVQSVAGYEFTQAAVFAVFTASFATAAFAPWREAVVAGFLVAAGLVLVFLTTVGVTWQTALSTWVSFSVLWGVAGLLRLYRASAARAERRASLFAADREARAREAVADERQRLARELHDSVGHALNVVVLHAGAAQRVVESKPALAAEALANIETAGRQALGDIERMLGILRAPDEGESLDKQPGVGQVRALCRQVSDAGVPVDLRVEGSERSLPASLDLTAYRIVQEALTNTLKHAGRTQASVTLRYAPDALVIEVLDAGRGAAAAPGGGGGRGLAGMRERVAIFGGELQAGPRSEGGYAVRARLPLEREGR
jgi:signal transduction histidine kinase